jgi:hypothetical protein
MTSPDPVQLTGEHRHTLSEIFRHPTSHNLEWHDVLSLLDAVGSAKETGGDSYLVTIAGEKQVFHTAHKKDIDTTEIVDLRRMLRAAGYEPPGD